VNKPSKAAAFGCVHPEKFVWLQLLLPTITRFFVDSRFPEGSSEQGAPSEHSNWLESGPLKDKDALDTL
jgi:hypothetical protein